MKSEKTSVLVVKDIGSGSRLEGDPVAVAVFNGKDHTFYSLNRMGMDEIDSMLNKCLEDKKV